MAALLSTNKIIDAKMIDEVASASSSRDEPTINHALLPGESFPPHYLIENASRRHTVLRDGCLWSSIGGTLIKQPYYNWKYAIESTTALYIPMVGDYVIGIVSQKTSDVHLVDINASFDASLRAVESFEGATKQWKPSLTVGSIVYCIVQQAHKDYETELTCKCMDDTKNWNTNEVYFGELKGGVVFTVPLVLAHSLLGDRSYILERLGKSIRYEIVVGMNGRIWVRADRTIDCIIIMNVIKHVYGLTLPQMEALCRKLLNE